MRIDKMLERIAIAVILGYTLLMLLVGLTSCSTQKQTQRKIDWLANKAPIALAIAARDKFPCTAGDTLIIDSVVLRDRPVLVKFPCPVYDYTTGIKDTLWLDGEIISRDTIVYRDRIIKVLDSALYHTVKAELTKAELAVQATAQKIIEEQLKKKNWKIATLILGTTIVGAIGVYLLKGKGTVLEFINSLIKTINKK